MIRRAFTLIELLVVIAIMVVLASMMLPILGQAGKFSARTETEAILRKVDTALRLFYLDIGAYPYQASYPDLDAGDPPSNRLNYHLGTDIETTDLDKVLVDAETAALKFDWDLSTSLPYITPGAAYVREDIKEVSMASATSDRAAAQYACRLAMEQNRLAVLAGNLWRTGPITTDREGRLVTDKSGYKILTNDAQRTSLLKPGFAKDYIKGEIKSEYIQGETILDGWQTPLVYINQSLPGFQIGRIEQNNTAIEVNWTPKRLGFGPCGYNVDEGPGPDLVVAERYWLIYSGRIRLDAEDCGDGQPPFVHPTYFPTAGDMMQSDVRYYAATGFENEFELWSAGEDESFAYMRNRSVNDDNIAVMPYLDGLKDE